MQLNQSAPEFALPDLHGVVHRLSSYRDKIVVLNFWSAACPHSERTDAYLLRLLEEWKGGVVMLAIASNRNEAPREIADAAAARRIPTLLLDPQQVAADLYEAVTTPHVFVVDREGILRYRGAVDNITFRRREATQFFVKEAVDALLQGSLPALAEVAPYGCAIIREI